MLRRFGELCEIFISTATNYAIIADVSTTLVNDINPAVVAHEVYTVCLHISLMRFVSLHTLDSAAVHITTRTAGCMERTTASK